jgi:hypothetical protein
MRPMNERRHVVAKDVLMFMCRSSVILSLGLIFLMSGCGSTIARFPGKDVSQVWSAMVTVAEEPEYPNWLIIENEVWVDSKTSRIEIMRILGRDRVRPGQSPRRESETWKFQITMTKSVPPTVKFFARQAAVPAHVWVEADRYFTDVRTLLDGTSIPVSEDAEEANVSSAG